MSATHPTDRHSIPYRVIGFRGKIASYFTRNTIRRLPNLPIGKRGHLPTVRCVYFVLNGIGDIIYIGQTVDLNARFRNHQKIRDFAGHHGRKIAWLQVKAPRCLNGIESDFIWRFKPILNQTWKGRSFLHLSHDLKAQIVNKAESLGISVEEFLTCAVESVPLVLSLRRSA